MSVRCPKCGTEHRLSAAIPPEGLLARCTSCAAVFRIEAPPADSYRTPRQQEEDRAASLRSSPPAQAAVEPQPPPPPPPSEPVANAGERELSQETASERPGPPAEAASSSLTVPSAPGAVVEQHTVDPNSAKDVLAMVFRGEQERREMMYHVTREISRLREAVEHQHELLAEVTEQVSDYAKRLSGALSAPGMTAPDRASTGLDHDHIDGRLRELEEALAREQEVVDRLRKSKLDLERRTAEAEAQLEDLRNRSLLDRLLGRDHD